MCTVQQKLPAIILSWSGTDNSFKHGKFLKNEEDSVPTKASNNLTILRSWNISPTLCISLFSCSYSSHGTQVDILIRIFTFIVFSEKYSFHFMKYFEILYFQIFEFTSLIRILFNCCYLISILWELFMK